MRAPYVMNWNAVVQRQLGRDWLVEFTYQGSSSVGLLNRWDINAIPGYLQRSGSVGEHPARSAELPTIPPFWELLHYSNYGHSSFHSGTVKVEKRMSSGFSFTCFYTWGKSIDEASDDSTATGVTFYNRRLEKARSNYDVTHRWITYAIWEIPVGKGKVDDQWGPGDAGDWKLGIGGDPDR